MKCSTPRMAQLAVWLVAAVLAACNDSTAPVTEAPSPGEGLEPQALITGTVNPPSALTATFVSPTRTDLSWVDGSSDETSFRLERRTWSAGTETWGAWQGVVETAPDISDYADSLLTPADRYSYRVRACAVDGCSAFAVLTPPAPPAAPDTVTATATGRGSIHLSWPTVANTSSYEVRRRMRDSITSVWSTAAVVAHVTAPGNTFDDTGLSDSDRYQYSVRACNAITCSGKTLSRTLIADFPPGAPTAVTLIAVASTYMELRWTDASNNETSFAVQRRDYDVAAGSWGKFGNDASLPANTSSFSENVLAGRHRYRVRACNAAGCSSWVTSGVNTAPTGRFVIESVICDLDVNTYGGAMGNPVGFSNQPPRLTQACPATAVTLQAAGSTSSNQGYSAGSSGMEASDSLQMSGTGMRSYNALITLGDSMTVIGTSQCNDLCADVHVWARGSITLNGHAVDGPVRIRVTQTAAGQCGIARYGLTAYDAPNGYCDPVSQVIEWTLPQNGTMSWFAYLKSIYAIETWGHDTSGATGGHASASVRIEILP